MTEVLDLGNLYLEKVSIAKAWTQLVIVSGVVQHFNSFIVAPRDSIITNPFPSIDSYVHPSLNSSI